MAAIAEAVIRTHDASVAIVVSVTVPVVIIIVPAGFVIVPAAFMIVPAATTAAACNAAAAGCRDREALARSRQHQGHGWRRDHGEATASGEKSPSGGDHGRIIVRIRHDFPLGLSVGFDARTSLSRSRRRSLSRMPPAN
jgi:hypothetical protein